MRFIVRFLKETRKTFIVGSICICAVWLFVNLYGFF